jgi:selenophosphate synthetase-related protein
MKNSELSDLIARLRNFEGLTRKAELGAILEIFEEKNYDDAGFLDVGDFKVVVSCDGIVENLVKNSPSLAGYYSVLVNVNDVVAKGAYPLGFVSVISSSSNETRKKISEGIREGLKKYGVKMLKGHLHSDTSYDAVDAAAIGVARNILPSTDAKVGDSLIVAVDLVGNFDSKSWLKTFDSTTMKSNREVLHRLNSMIEMADRKLAHAAKDISGPGVIGTIAMLCESSKVGTRIDLEKVPKPNGVCLEDWLMTYLGIGFVVSTRQPIECLYLLQHSGLSAATVGKVTSDKKIWLYDRKRRELFFDLKCQSVFGVARRKRNPTEISLNDLGDF